MKEMYGNTFMRDSAHCDESLLKSLSVLVVELPDHVLTDLEFYLFVSTNFTSNNYSNYVTLF